jgi:transposase
MGKVGSPRKRTVEAVVKDIKRQTRRKFSSEEKIRIVLEGLKGEESISEICRREGIAPTLYYRWSKDFIEAGKKRLNGDTEREANSFEVDELRKESNGLKMVVAEQALEIRVLKKDLRGLK